MLHQQFLDRLKSLNVPLKGDWYESFCGDSQNIPATNLWIATSKGRIFFGYTIDERPFVFANEAGSETYWQAPIGCRVGIQEITPRWVEKGCGSLHAELEALATRYGKEMVLNVGKNCLTAQFC